MSSEDSTGQCVNILSQIAAFINEYPEYKRILESELIFIVESTNPKDTAKKPKNYLDPEFRLHGYKQAKARAKSLFGNIGAHNLRGIAADAANDLGLVVPAGHMTVELLLQWFDSFWDIIVPWYEAKFRFWSHV